MRPSRRFSTSAHIHSFSSYFDILLKGDLLFPVTKILFIFRPVKTV